MSILSVDTIQPIGSGSTVTLNAAKIVVGTGITFESNGQAIYAGIITATSFSGSGANLTSLPAQATIANNADNRVITGGSGVNLNGEANFSYDGTRCLIGTNTAAPYVNRNLTVAQGSSGNTTVAIEVRSPTNGDGRIIFTDSTSAGTGAYKGQIRYDQTNDFMSFNTNGDNERFRIQADGDVSFGNEVTGRAQIKHVSGDQSDVNSGGFPQYAFVGNEGTGMRRVSSNVLAFDSTGAERLRIDSIGRITQKGGDLIIDNSNNGYGGLRIVDSSAGEYSVNYIAGRNSGATAHVFRYNGRTQNSSPWANNSLGVEMGRWSGYGIAFGGDTAAANSLDDYEEGVHEYTENANLTAHGSYDGAVYTKIGRLVHYSGLINVSAHSGSDAVTISLPFTALSNSAPSRYFAATAGVIHTGVNTGDAGLAAYITGGATVMKFMKLNDSGSWSSLINSDMSVGCEIYWGITYTAA